VCDYSVVPLIVQLRELGPDLGLVLARDFLTPPLAVRAGLEADYAALAARTMPVDLRVAAAGTPEQFCDLLLPYMLRVMQLTEVNPQTHPVIDGHFGQYADWAADLLLEGDHRFISGYTRNSVWMARLLLQIITPHASPRSFTDVENAVMALQLSWEGGRLPAGLFYAALRHGRGQAFRGRQAATRRATPRFSMEQPPEPTDYMGGSIQSPIPLEAASRMTDEQWLRAMIKHNTDRTDFTTLTGGALELSQVLQRGATTHPARFARLALRLTVETHPAWRAMRTVLRSQSMSSGGEDPGLVGAQGYRHAALV
jgi:hypothetical protein